MVKNIQRLIFKFLYWLTRLKFFDMTTGSGNEGNDTRIITRQLKIEHDRRRWDVVGEHLVIHSDETAILREFCSDGSKKKLSEFLWAEYTENSVGRSFSFGPRQQERYEKFCLGFLYFYDKYIYTEGAHSIYFKWGETDNRSSGSAPKPGTEGYASKVSIFISPPPRRFDRQRDLRYIPATSLEESDPPKPPAPPPPEMGLEDVVI